MDLKSWSLIIYLDSKLSFELIKNLSMEKKLKKKRNSVENQRIRGWVLTFSCIISCGKNFSGNIIEIHIGRESPCTWKSWNVCCSWLMEPRAVLVRTSFSNPSPSFSLTRSGVWYTKGNFAKFFTPLLRELFHGQMTQGFDLTGLNNAAGSKHIHGVNIYTFDILV